MNRATTGAAIFGEPDHSRLATGLRVLAVTWLVLTATTLVGLLAVGSERAAAIDVAPSNEPAGPSVRYGGLDWAVNEVRTVPRTDDPFSRPVVIVEAVVTNVTGAALRIHDADVTLVDPDGRHHPLDRFENTPDSHLVTVDPAGSTAITAVFKPAVATDPWPADYAIEVAEANRTPAVINLGLDPDQGRDQAPVVGRMDLNPVEVEMAGAGRLVVEPRSAVMTLNAGAYRAARGERVHLIEVTVGNVGATLYEGSRSVFDPGFWSLRTNTGAVVSARRVDATGAGTVGDNLTVTFLVDGVLAAGPGSTFELLIGGDGQTPTVVPISYPDPRTPAQPLRTES